jgi:hypothetical protein
MFVRIPSSGRMAQLGLRARESQLLGFRVHEDGFPMFLRRETRGTGNPGHSAIVSARMAEWSAVVVCLNARAWLSWLERCPHTTEVSGSNPDARIWADE